MPSPSRPAACTLLLLTVLAVAEEAGRDEPQRTHLLVELTDGSSFYGTTSLTKIGVKTAYLEGEVPLAQVREVERDRNGESLVFSMSNGDQLRGALLQGSFPLKSLLGELTIPGKHVQRIEILPDGASAIPRAGLVAYYPADGDTQDASGNGHHGVNKGCSWTAGRFGDPKGAFLFDGRRRLVRIEDSPKLDTDEAFAVSAWIRPRAYVDAAGRASGILYKWYSCPWQGQPGKGDYGVFLGGDGRLCFQVANTDKEFISDAVASESAIPTNVWSHVAATFDQGAMKLYINGHLARSKVSERVKVTSREEYTHDCVTFGGLWDGDSSFNGAIDEVRIYNRALYRGEIRRLASTKLTSRAWERPERELSLRWLLAAGFEIPKEAKDKHGNAIRQGSDEKTRLPLEIRHQKTGMHLVFIPDGAFLMGSDEGGERRYAHRERPQHVVRITRPFYMGKYEVTTGEFAQFVEDTDYTTEAERRGQGHTWNGKGWTWTAGANWKNPNFPQTANHPVVLVSWNDAQNFAKWLNTPTPFDRAQRGPPHSHAPTPPLFSLPTEAQWEYAHRAGTNTRFYFGAQPTLDEIKQHLWLRANSDGGTHAVGQKKPNPWGLYDIMGNTAEWLQDWYGSYPAAPQIDPKGPLRGADRVVRGGNWLCAPQGLRVTLRGIEKPDYCSTNRGFRVALAVPELDGLALWLRADTGVVKDAEGGVSKWEDLSGRANHAYQSNGTKRPHWAKEPDVGRQALIFDGTNDQMDISHSDSLNLTKAISVAAWVKPEQSDRCIHPEIIGKYTWVRGQRTWNCVYDQKVGKFGFSIWGPNGRPQAWVHSETPIAFNSWQHFVGVFQPRRIAIYVDGRLETEREISVTSLASFPNVPVQIGWVRGGSEREFLKGAIDDIRIYGRALAGQEIAVLAEDRPKE